MALLRGLKSGLERSALEGLQVPGDTGPSVYTGSLPNNIGELSGWTGTSCWTVMHNLKNTTTGPFACVSSSDGASYNLQKLGAGSTAALAAAPQSNFASQGGYTVNTNTDFLYGVQSALWKFSATVPTGYLLTFKFGGTPTSGQIFYGGLDGANGGWYLEAHATSGIRAGIGSGSAYVNTSYVGGTSFYDGEYHTVLLVIDDAAGKAKIYSEFGNTESTGLTIASVNAFLTIGPQAALATWGTDVTYLLSARGEHPLLYTNAQLAFDAYEDARLNGTHPAAITSLPTTLAEVNSLTSIPFTHAWNVNSATPSPMTGSAGSAMAAETASIFSGNPGVAPSVAAAPQVRTSFTAQAAARFPVSTWANLKADLPLAHQPYALIIIYKQASAAAAKPILGRGSSGTPRGFLVNSPGDDRSYIYQVNSGGSVTLVGVPAPATSNGTWRVFAGSVKPTATALQALNDNGQVASAATVLTTNSAAADQGYLGAQAAHSAGSGSFQVGGETHIAMVAWVQSPGVQPDATALSAASNALRWRYGI